MRDDDAVSLRLISSYFDTPPKPKSDRLPWPLCWLLVGALSVGGWAMAWGLYTILAGAR